jgi:hypothetical protein
LYLYGSLLPVVCSVGGLMSYCVVCIVGGLMSYCVVSVMMYNTTQTTQYDMSPPILQTTGGKDPYKYNKTQITQYDEPSYTTNNWR